LNRELPCFSIRGRFPTFRSHGYADNDWKELTFSITTGNPLSVPGMAAKEAGSSIPAKIVTADGKKTVS